MGRGRSALIVLAWLGGCTAAPVAPEPAAALKQSEQAQPTVHEGPTPSDTQRDAVDANAFGQGAIGFSRAPQLSAAARAANRRALKLHKQADYAASRVGFQEAVALSPDHDMARFNLACALSRLGELAAARDELETLLHRDLMRFQERWRGADADDDFENLRKSEHAQTIDALIDRLRATYDAAHDLGIPAYLYGHTDYRSDLGVDERVPGGVAMKGGTTNMVAGVWVHEVRRFVPLARGGDLALLDLPGRRVLRAQVAPVSDGHCVETHGWASVGTASTHPDPAKRMSSGVELVQETFGVDPDADMYPLQDWETGWTEGALGVNAGWAYKDVFVTVSESAGVQKQPAKLRFEGTWIEVLAEGGRLHAVMPEGFALRRRMLTVPGRSEPIRLGHGYDQVFASSDPAAPVFAMRRRYRPWEDIDTPAVNDTTVERVDLGSGTTTRLAHGHGAGWVVLGPKGDVYVQAGTQTLRWATARAEASEPTMDGLQISMPLGDPFCTCCG